MNVPLVIFSAVAGFAALVSGAFTQWFDSRRGSNANACRTRGGDAIQKPVSERHGDVVCPSDGGPVHLPHDERGVPAGYLVLKFGGDIGVGSAGSTWRRFLRRQRESGYRGSFWFRIGEQPENRRPDPVALK